MKEEIKKKFGSIKELALLNNLTPHKLRRMVKNNDPAVLELIEKTRPNIIILSKFNARKLKVLMELTGVGVYKLLQSFDMHPNTYYSILAGRRDAGDLLAKMGIDDINNIRIEIKQK